MGLLKGIEEITVSKPCTIVIFMAEATGYLVNMFGQEMAGCLLLVIYMKVIILLASLTLSLSGIAAVEGENTLNPFESDGCSMVPDTGLFTSKSWLNCCTPHDYRYWKGGTAEEKEKADLDFKVCMEKNDLGSLLSQAFYYGVSIGGSPSVKTTWRWGYGWSKLRAYAPFSKSEKKQIDEYQDLLKLPIFMRTPEFAEWMRDTFTTRNSCKVDMLKKVKMFMDFKAPQDQLKIHRVEGKGGDRFQIFSPECKGGYMVVDFHNTIHFDLCAFSEYAYNQVERIKSFQVYGTCTNFKRR